MAENKWVTGVITLRTGVTTPSTTSRGPPCRYLRVFKLMEVDSSSFSRDGFCETYAFFHMKDVCVYSVYTI